jgi:hypothetical protein
MAVSNTDFIRLVRFQPTPQGGEPHGIWRGDVAKYGDGSGGDNTIGLTVQDKLLLVMYGYYVKVSAAAEYDLDVKIDETGKEFGLVRRTLVPSYNGEDEAYETCYIVLDSPSQDFTFLQGRIANVSGRAFTIAAHGVYWEPSLLRQLNVTPILRG